MKDRLQKIYYLLGEGFSKGSVFLVFHVFTNNLDKVDFGKLSLFWVAVPLSSIFIDLAQRSYVKRAYLEKEINVIDLLRNVYIVSSLTFILLLSIKQILSWWDIYLIDQKFDIYVLVSAYLFVLIEMVLSYYQIKGDALKYNILYFIRTGLSYLVTAAIFIYYLANVHVYPWVYMIVLSLCCFPLLWLLWRRSTKIEWQSFVESIRSSLTFSMPLILGVLSAIGLNAADRFIVNYYGTEEDVANYTVAYTVAMIFMAFFMATNKWWQKFVLDALNENRIHQIRKKFLYYLFLVLIVGLGVLIFKKEIVLMLSNSGYLEVLGIIPVLLLGMFFYFLYTVLINVPFYFKRTKIQILPALVAFFLNLILNFILIPEYGYKIAAWTTCISYFFEFAIMYTLCIKVFRIDFIFGPGKSVLNNEQY
ncbi:oligosaccharide flippase family protein [Muricauda sp. TY007]|uniref:MATE family efflux transporter n=1 Tax=Allomuricauda sp. TY007 TaxID=2683200 RepID=UPI0013C0259C|nr:polysaccharide biosynthesis C-terminal domain-containing protein [Muricauda sp. TY007]NDV14597.1 oligosaccharide flippase family protein [Muricauda sp. TY007]